MALSDTITFTVPDPDVVFATTRALPDGKERLNEATDLTEPEKLLIRHTSQTQAGVVTDRHLVQFSRQERDEDTGKLHTLVMNLTIAVPRTGQFTTTEVARIESMLHELLTSSGVLARILRGES